ncbi:penicillin-binding transpeptidase domain-containing protein [Methylopila henanensis]|uniref:Penicillin-binding transpeptidase domain-containing protein n=1 Tax=Methylopila henanensis TaxID=873516 RepID=A0ABW4KBM8_9HYPH
MADRDGCERGFAPEVRSERRRPRLAAAARVAVAVALCAPASTRAQGPTEDFAAAFGRAFHGVAACGVLRDVAAGAQPAVSDPEACGERLPPCAAFEVAANVVAIDRGIVSDADAPIRREPQGGDAEQKPEERGVSLRDAFRKPEPWVYGELARRIGPEAYGKALAALRYGNADASGQPVERMWLGESPDGLRISPVEQVDFLARLKRGELPTSAESQARAVEIIPFERIPEGLIAWKSGECGPAGGGRVAWAVGWVDRGGRSTIYAAVEKGAEVTGEDALGRMRAVLNELSLTPPAKR